MTHFPVYYGRENKRRAIRAISHLVIHSDLPGQIGDLGERAAVGGRSRIAQELIVGLERVLRG